MQPLLIGSCTVPHGFQPRQRHVRSPLNLLPQARSRRVSSVPERTRKLPFAGGPRTLKAWQRSFLVGLALGAVATPAWLYYEKKRYTDSFVNYKLVRTEPVSSTASIFHLQPADRSTDFAVYRHAWNQGVWNFQFKQPQIQIVRPYTPLPPVHGSDSSGDDTLRFLIRKEPQGEVSNYIHNLPTGANVELRGPNLECVLPEDIKQVIFLAGGTGISPALQVAHAMFHRSQKSGNPANIKERELHILWANRRREDCMGGVNEATAAVAATSSTGKWNWFSKKSPDPPFEVASQRGLIVEELENLKNAYPGQITVEYFVNEEHTYIDQKSVTKALSRLNDKFSSTASPREIEQRQIIISGPLGFIGYLAGPKEWRNGREEQGELTRLLAHILSQNPHNVKVWKV